MLYNEPMPINTDTIKRLHQLHISERMANRIELNDDNSFLIFPFELKIGFVDSTETGLVKNPIISDYTHFEKVFTGLENVLAQWENAYELEKNQADTALVKTYKVGRTIKGLLQESVGGITFEPSPISNDFVAGIIDKRYTLTIYEKFKDEDWFKFFLIPELEGNTWLVPVAYKESFKGTQYIQTTITFATIKNEIATSGRAVQQFVQRSAPGEGYAFPTITRDPNLPRTENRIVSLDNIRDRDIPINSFQIEFAGSSAVSTMFAYGRVVERSTDGTTKFNPEIQAPRMLLPLTMEVPVPSPVNTRPTAESDFYYANLTTTQWTNYEKYTKRYEARFDLSMRKQYAGVFTSPQTLGQVRQTNPLSGATTNKLLWDPTFTVPYTRTFDTTPSYLAGDEVVLTGSHTIPELLAHAAFTQAPIESLPVEKEINTTYQLRDIPLIGGFLNFLSMGFPLGYNKSATRFGVDSSPYLIPKSAVEFGNVVAQGNIANPTDVLIPLDTFDGTNESLAETGINSTGTILKVEITNFFTKDINGTTYTLDTVFLGQDHPTQDALGATITGTLPDILFWDGTCKPAPRLEFIDGYVIDISVFKAMAKLDYRQTFFSGTTQIWTGSYNTNSLFTGFSNDWTNTIKMSAWDQYDGEPVPFPATIVAPEPPDVNNPDFAIEGWEHQTVVLGDYQELVFNLTFNFLGSGFAVEYLFNDYSITDVQSPVFFFNLNPYGGSSLFPTNYETLEFVFDELRESIQVSIATLFASGTLSVNIVFSIDDIITNATYSVLNDSGSVINTTTRTMTEKSVAPSTMELRVFNNNIELSFKTGATGTWNSLTPLNTFKPGNTFGSPNLDNAFSTIGSVGKTFHITRATAIAKRIP